MSPDKEARDQEAEGLEDVGPNAELPDTPDADVVELRAAAEERGLWGGQ